MTKRYSVFVASSKQVQRNPQLSQYGTSVMQEPVLILNSQLSSCELERPLSTKVVSAFEKLDNETQEHATRVAFIVSRMFALPGQPDLFLATDNAKAANITIAALCHDIGKVHVANAILKKPGRLTAEEECILRCHPMAGQLIASADAGAEEIASAIGQHHERWDGNGYPYRLSREDVCLGARIISVADAFDAIVSRRSYSLGLKVQEALTILEAGAGTQWDPQIVHTFVNMRRKNSCAFSQRNMAAFKRRTRLYLKQNN